MPPKRKASSVKQPRFQQKQPAKKAKKSSLLNPPNKTPFLELKNYDTDNSITPLAGVGTFQIQNLNTITQGITSSNRIGRRVTMKKFVMNWTISCATGAGTGGWVRIRVVYDRQTNGAQPAVTDVFNTNNGLSHNNLFNSKRFITLCDVQTPAIAVNELPYANGEVNVDINLETMFSGVGGTIADLSTGGVFILASQVTVNAATVIILSYSARIRYTDA